MIKIYDYLEPSLPADRCDQHSALSIIQNRVSTTNYSPKKILDLGCGVGKSMAQFKSILPDAEWAGVDIESSPEVAARSLTGSAFHTYDGINLPFPDNYFDLVYSHQVFEHVRYPEALLVDARRVIAPGGLFVGQTSHLEPYHSYSIFNYTPYGWKVIAEAAGFDVKELRPGIDGITLTKRSYLGHDKSFNRWFVEESPLNLDIQSTAVQKKLSTKVINFRKLMHSGQFCFVMSPIMPSKV